MRNDLVRNDLVKRGMATGGLALGAVLAMASAASGQLVNGGFEPGPGGAQHLVPGNSTVIPGWTTTDTGVEWFAPAATGLTASPAGGYVVDLANYTFTAGGIRQAFTTVPGRRYRIVYFIGTHRAAGRDGTCEITVELNGVTTTDSVSHAGADIRWERRELLFTAEGTQGNIAFRCTQNAFTHFAYIDGVQAVRACGADFNDDGFLDFFDYDDFVRCFETGECQAPRTADFNDDGFVDFFDYDDYVFAFETGC